jgi:hypothetical protein
LEEVYAVTPEGIQAVAQELLTDDLLCMSVIAPPRTTSGLEKALHI